MRCINVNGGVYPAGEKIFSLNRAVNYGDGLFESIRILNHELLFFDEHLQRLFSGMEALKMEVPDTFSEFYFHKQIHDLMTREQAPANARVRIGVFRSGAGLYLPDSNRVEYFIEIMPMSSGFEWNAAPCVVDVFQDVLKCFSAVSAYKTMNALPHVLASLRKKEMKLDDLFLINPAGNIADATSSNVFWIKDDIVCSPPVTDGGVAGVMRRQIIQVTQENGIPFTEQSVSPDELLKANEVFLTNVSWAVKPVSQFRQRQYSSRLTNRIFSLLLDRLS